MKIEIRDPRIESLIERHLASGGYADVEAVVAEALLTLGEREEWLREHGSEVGEKVERALGQFERGECYTAEESRAELTRRKAEWMAERSGRG